MEKTFIVLLFLLTLFSCNEYSDVDCDDFDYSTCGDEPSVGSMEVLVTLIDDSAQVELILLRGKLGEPACDTVFHDSIAQSSQVFALPLNEDYTAMAIYYINNKIVKAVDGAFFAKKSVTVCDTTCWSLSGDLLDVRLKNLDI